MTHPNGYNPMRWRCEDRGCYNVKHRPKIEEFAKCLPGRIGMTDVDAMTEVGGRILMLEFKGEGVNEVPTGQRIAFERMTRLSSKITVVVISGNAETMEVRAIKKIEGGRWGAWEICNLAQLKDRIHSWAVRAAAKPRLAA